MTGLVVRVDSNRDNSYSLSRRGEVQAPVVDLKVHHLLRMVRNRRTSLLERALVAVLMSVKNLFKVQGLEKDLVQGNHLLLKDQIQKAN